MNDDMILQNGFSIVHKLFETRTEENPFFRKRMKHGGDKFYKMYRFLLAAANIAQFKGLPRGWLEITYREIAEHVGVSMRTVFNYMNRLVSIGFILLKPKVNKRRSAKTALYIVDYPPRKSKGKQEPTRSYIEQEREEDLIKTPTPSRDSKAPVGGSKIPRDDFLKKKRFSGLQNFARKVIGRYAVAAEATPGGQIAAQLPENDRLAIAASYKSLRGLEAEIMRLANTQNISCVERVLSWRIANKLDKLGYRFEAGELKRA